MAGNIEADAGVLPGLDAGAERSAEAGAAAIVDAAYADALTTQPNEASSDAARMLDAETASDGTVPDASRSGPDASRAAPDASRTAPDASVPGPQPASAFHGVNWADRRDNYVDGLLELSGLSASADTYASVANTTHQIAAEFRAKLGANAIRIPINEPTVASAWWDAYKAVIDTATTDGMPVMVAYWAHHNGKPDSEAAFKTMWQKVVAAYVDNPRVYFDIHNEPYGFGADWNDEAARWLGYFPEVPRGRVLVAGTGYDENVKPVGSDKRFDGCLLELHFYAFWHTDWTTQKQWLDALSGAVGDYAARTVVGEWGNTMSTGIAYDAATRDGSNAVSYVTSMADFTHTRGMGSCYWPGLRDGDTYSITRRDTRGTTTTLSVVNTSGLDRLHWAWGL